MNRRRFIHNVSAALASAIVPPALGLRQPPPREVDFIVVGAGSAGCALVSRLTANRAARVLLIEAGPSERSNPAITTPGRWVSLIGSPYDWGYGTRAEPGMNGRRVAFPRGKVIGGCSAINAMTYIRGHRADFDGWARAGNRGWSYDEVLPAFRRLEDNSRGASQYHGAGGPLRVSDCLDPHAGHEAFLDAARRLGYQASPTWDFNAPQPEGAAGYYQKNIKDGRRHSAAEAFLAPALTRPNLQVITDAQAQRVILEGTRAVGIEITRGGRRERIRAAREIILCAGVIDSPKLLMLSGIGPAAHLRALAVPVVADLRGVGGNLQDHLKLSIRWNGRTTLPASTVTAGLFARSRMAAHGHPAPDLQFYVGRGVDQPDRFVTITVSLVRPRSRGAVRLRSADAADAPIIEGNYLQDGADVEALIDGVRLARELAATAAYEKLRGDEIEPGAAVRSGASMVDFVRRAADTIYHPAGTCRMGTDESAVVDAELRVRGIERLRVADASIMPDVVNATTHAACVMIGDRAAELAPW